MKIWGKGIRWLFCVSPLLPEIIHKKLQAQRNTVLSIHHQPTNLAINSAEHTHV